MGKEKFKTYGNVFDEFTNRNLFKLLSQGHFEGMESPVATGKESNVFTAKKGDEKVIVKIYRLENCDFNKMFDYIKYDLRYQNIKKQKRTVIFSWAQREFRNLHKAREANLDVPLPITSMHNIIVMSMIGEPAPKLKDRVPKQAKKFLKLIIEQMKRLHRAGLVHGDLSEFNILNHNEKPYLIDFSQSTTTKSINAEELLERDCKNMTRYFKKIGVEIDWEKIKEEVKK
ncbi:serine protein kinase RIO [Candidatus Woesearchaeota archaeon]|nr:serine protein kinase RIO [Candidatus Woesearchaeota archaeon]